MTPEEMYLVNPLTYNVAVPLYGHPKTTSVRDSRLLGASNSRSADAIALQVRIFVEI